MADFKLQDSFFTTSDECPFILRRATMDDCPRFDVIFEQCRKFMHSYGNTKQWTGNFPNSSLMHSDIESGNTVACVNKHSGEVVGVCTIADYEPVYDQKTAVWQSDRPYVVIHRLAAATASKSGRFLIEHVMQHFNHIRLDTHQDNQPMIRLMQRLNYKYTGYVIYERPNGDGHRITFDYLK